MGLLRLVEVMNERCFHMGGGLLGLHSEATNRAYLTHHRNSAGNLDNAIEMAFEFERPQ